MTLSDDKLERNLRAIFSSESFDLDAETTKTIRNKLCRSLGLDGFPSEKKTALKEMIKRLVNEEEEEEDSDEAAEESPSPKKSKSKSQKSEKSEAPTNKYNADVKSLIELGTAMRMGPRIHRGLKDMESNKARVEALQERLVAAGASWNGKIPSKTDIEKAKQERQRLDDLDGIDTSLIIDTSKGRRRGRTTVGYAPQEEEAEEEEEEAERPRKRGKQRQVSSSDDDDDFDGESSEEEEFE